VPSGLVSPALFRNYEVGGGALNDVLTVTVNPAIDVAYAKRNGDLVLVTRLLQAAFETDGVHKFVETVNDALIEAVELTSLLPLQFAVGGYRRQETGGQGCVEPLEQFQDTRQME
jgi:hypothetical protein